ncbi:MAG TPA: helix-turn-helix domain-containing protein [Pyrodictium sp.]|nr:helix-turn-helix domain-containing protein [Pyrodictium sp.]
MRWQAPSRLEELYACVADALEKKGYRVEIVSYPTSHDKRSIDLLAASTTKNIFIKIVEDLKHVNNREASELKGLSTVLDAHPLIVAEKEEGVELDDMAAYEKHGLYAVNVGGLEAALENSIYVVKRHGNFYMRIDSKKLREFRRVRGLSLGDLAELVGVSRKTVYEYERSNMDVSLSTAIRLLEVIGDEIFKPIPVLDRQEKSVKRSTKRMAADTVAERKIILQVEKRGGEAIHSRHSPIDIGVKFAEKKAVVIVEHKHDADIGFRGEEAVKIAKAASAEKIALIRHANLRKDLEALGYDVVRTPEELLELVVGKRGKK